MAPGRSSASDDVFSELELDAWRGLLRVHAQLVRALDQCLDEEHRLPLSQYEVLVRVADAPDQRVRMCDLADDAHLSRSGLTRLVDRLAREGLIERCACEDDARGSFACLTTAGRARLAEAGPTHRAAVRERFLSAFDEHELVLLAALWQRLIGVAEPERSHAAPDPPSP